MQSQRDRSVNRRSFLQMSGVASGGFLLLESPQKTETLEEVSPLEDLMREHGVLTRVLLVYRELIRRVQARQDVPPDTIREATGSSGTSSRNITSGSRRIICSRGSRRRAKLTDLTAALRAQHQAGRRLTDRIARQTTASANISYSDGFAKEVDRVSAIEQRLGIYDLAQFTPRT